MRCWKQMKQALYTKTVVTLIHKRHKLYQGIKYKNEYKQLLNQWKLVFK